MIVQVYISIIIVFGIIVNGKDLYEILGTKKSASQKDIRKAYRSKAKETHPDKHISSEDKEEATESFREVVEAYEILSDENSRKEYDRTGQTSNQRSNQQWNQNSHSNRNQNNNWNWDWDFNSFFHGRNRQNNQHSQQQQQQQQRRKHRYFYDPHVRPQIIDAQSRVITIKSRRHLKSIIYTDIEDPISTDYKETKEQQQMIIDRYTLIAFYNSSIPNCLEFMFEQLLFPWPFAGYSGMMADKSDGIWWDETMIVGLVDIQANAGSRELGKYFGINEMNTVYQCPFIGFIPRSGSIDDRYQAEYFNNHDDYSKYVWSKLKMNIYFRNMTPWPLTQYWLDGMRGKQLASVAPGDTFYHNTFISHTFFLRADFVTGYTLTNESGLLWYVSKIQDDGKTIDIIPRCFDRSGECTRWKSEGFCSRTSHTFYTRQNPSFVDWVVDNCFISCGTGCGKVHRDEL